MKRLLMRYEMAYSQAEHGWLVVYARTLEEAQEKFENGEYVLESEN